MAFSFEFRGSAADIGGAAFVALLAAGWAMTAAFYASHQLDGSPPTAEERLEHARAAFLAVASNFPAGNGFRSELERYAAEELPRLINDPDFDPKRPNLKLV